MVHTYSLRWYSRHCRNLNMDRTAYFYFSSIYFVFRIFIYFSTIFVFWYVCMYVCMQVLGDIYGSFGSIHSMGIPIGGCISTFFSAEEFIHRRQHRWPVLRSWYCVDLFRCIHESKNSSTCSRPQKNRHEVTSWASTYNRHLLINSGTIPLLIPVPGRRSFTSKDSN